MKPVKGMKVFKIGDSDWIAARSLPAARKFYIDQTGVELDPDDDSYELSDKQMETHSHHGDERAAREIPLSFRAELERIVEAGEEFPCFFASREW